jgi:hypothetical protein
VEAGPAIQVMLEASVRPVRLVADGPKRPLEHPDVTRSHALVEMAAIGEPTPR